MNLKLLGSSLIIAGTALGAGMLAIPMVLAQFGLLSGTILMLVIWSGTTYAALLLLEASIKVRGGLGMNTIAKQSLGKGGQLITNGLLYALLICLLMAYIIGAGDLVHKMVLNLGLDISLVQSQILFAVIAGGIVAAGTGVIDKLNRVLFLLMLAVLVITLFALVPNMSLAHFFTATNDSSIDLIKTSAVLFTSFGFFPVIPSLVSYNENATHAQLRNMVLLGSLIPLVCYLLWLYAVVGSLSYEQLTQFNNVSELINVLATRFEGIHVILSIFTGLALLTSFFGVALSLFDQNIDLFKQNRAVTYVLTFILPLLGAIFAAEKFLAVLSYAGLIMVFIAVFIPMMMAINLRKSEGKTQTAISNDEYYEVGGGQIAMMVCFSFGLFLIGAQVI
ncbi:amino acid permease [Photobacterium leiognathi]|uniref:Tyrosine transporter n=2 Tax=Photobacterium leiognathi TaxID=553611 RepID=A0A2T3M8M7_PHOLE|nr:aromatic amino acid transport family protein [Photobacterium leiognathi]KJF87325.1 tyrosine transporter [Photobacterium leiognathi]KJF97181.1 tyrosine transporter [Photobacterium leiognathi]PSV78508.1 tyrosine transporter [Photobacterium leiognathi]PSV88835.1 tyrosine transporter [Photobacterium leiognathi]GAD29252.1 putative tyrosine-specific transport protein [Photobacterium leiognathi lrivu.4.1]